MAAPSGGGGGGGPVGFSNSFTGTGEGIDIYGNHVAAYSGAIATANTEIAHLQFKTGNYYLVVRIQPTYLSNQNANYLWQIYISEIAIAQVEHTSSESSGWNFNLTGIVIPSYTDFKVTCINSENVNTNDMGTVLTGRIYR